MHDLYALKESLVKELKHYGMKGGLSASSLDVVDKLAHAAKNVAKVIECCEEEEYSGRGYSRGMSNRMSQAEGSYADSSYADSYYVRPDGSYARGRGSGAKRDSMGRYSREGEMDEQTKQKLRDMIEKM